MRDTIIRALPEVARWGGRDEITTLVEALEEVSAREGLAGRPPVVVMARLLPALTRTMGLLEEDNRRILDDLAIGRGTGNERATLVESLGRLSGGRALADDLKATQRHLDSSAVADRCHLRLHSELQRWTFLVTALAAAPLTPLPQVDAGACLKAATSVLQERRWHWTARAAAARLVGRLCEPPFDGSPASRQALLDRAHDRGDDPWVQAAALRAYVWIQASPADVEAVLRGFLRLRPDQVQLLPAGHAFVRARAAGLAAEHGRWELLRALLAHKDPSEHVRIAVSRALARSPRAEDHRALRETAVDRGREPSAVVRAATTIAMLPDDFVDDAEGAWVSAVHAALHPLASPWVVQTVLEAVQARLDLLGEDAQAVAEHRWRASLEHWIEHAISPDLARIAASVALRLQAQGQHPEAWRDLRSWLRGSQEGAALRFTSGPVADLNEDELLDTMAALAAEGPDLSAHPVSGGWRLFHGEPPRRALWRLLFELRHPRPDKRQGYDHLVDRQPRGSLIAPSGVLSEVTPTAVPGQRLASPTTGWWGEELPLLSAVHAAARHRQVRVRTPTVDYTIRSTRPLARLRLAVAHAGLAEKRSRDLARPLPEAIVAWDGTLRGRGFEVERTPLLLGAALLDLDDLVRHVLATDTNTVAQLALLSAAWGGWWVGRDLLRERRTRRLRASVPLVIGGWGSRGKSGTERLKAALFHGLGYTVLAKTTGSEATLLSSIPGGQPAEITLFRPYERTSIIEQRAVLRIASRMGVQVLLWECMALRPEYVGILQRDWMRDDFTTLTNTYPDHEDIQGPTGRDVAETIAGFMPPDGRVLSTEQHMTPVLQAQAGRVGARLQHVRPERWKLLPRDILAAFSYAEHPRNIALVVALAERLGVPEDVALRAMAAHVIPDIGVLKEYGPISYEGRVLSFINGMSANERAGFLSNWARMGLDARPDTAGLDDILVMVVNNRADRLPRQSTFARIAAVEAPVDAIVVIGTNVQAFHEEWRAALQHELRPLLVDAAAGEPGRLLHAIARRIRRRPLPPGRVREVLGARPELSAEVVEAVVAEVYGGERARLCEALGQVARADDPAQVALAWARQVGWLWRLEQTPDWPVDAVLDGLMAILRARVHLLVDPGLTGDQVFDEVAHRVPSGASARVLGAANIKGTGLPFVQRWLSIEQVLGWTRRMARTDAPGAVPWLRALGAHADYGVADAQVALDIVQTQLDAGAFLGVEAEAHATVERLTEVLEAARRQLQAGGRLPWREATGRWARATFDLFGSIQRRRQADQLYKDLGERRIGAARAAIETRALSARQKR